MGEMSCEARVSMKLIRITRGDHAAGRIMDFTHFVFSAVYFKKGDGALAVDLIARGMPKITLGLDERPGE